jgi:Peptidase family M1 domain
MGVRVGWPGVLAAALIGAILGALLTWATLTGGNVVRGARPTAAPRTVTMLPMLPIRPAKPVTHASAATDTPVRLGRVASPLQLAATYDFDVDLDYAAGRAVVAERVRITNLGSRVDTLQLFVLPHLDADGAREFELRKFEVDGSRPALRWTQQEANLVVPLPAPLGHGATTDLVIDFTIHAAANVAAMPAAAVSKAEGMMQMLLWYPMLSDGHGVAAYGDPVGATPVADVRFRLRSASPVDFAVPGVLSTRTRHEVVGRLERARDFAFAISPHFRRWTGGADGERVEVYSRPGGDGATGRDLAIRALGKIASVLKAPYPASRFVLVAGMMDMESSGLAFVHQDALASEYRITHETAHQWFPWLVGSDQQREPWLDEALATYLATDLHGPHVPWCSYLPVDRSVEQFLVEPPQVAAATCTGYVETVYLKGAAMFAAIDRAMGHRAFLAAIREYVASERWAVASAHDLVRVLRAHAPDGAKLDAILRVWLSQPAIHGRQPNRGMGPLA